VCVRVCVCVREREREREIVCVYLCAFVCKSVFVCGARCGYVRGKGDCVCMCV